MKDFEDFGALSAQLLRLSAMGEAVTHHITEKGAQAIEKDAKQRIGSYQDGVGGFPAWANLAQSTIDDRLRKGFTPDDPLLRTGELRDSIEHRAEGNTAVIGTPDVVAFYQEMGTEKIPPRPFLGPAGFNSKNSLGPVTGATVIAWLSGGPYKRPKVQIRFGSLPSGR